MAFRFIHCNQDFNGANVKSHNGGTLGLGTSRNVSSVSNSSLQQLVRVSAMKEGPAKELRLSLMSGEKYVNKIFRLFFRV